MTDKYLRPQERELRRLAESATQDGGDVGAWWTDFTLGTAAPAFSLHDRAYVEACDPSVLISLLDELGRLREALAQLRRTHVIVEDCFYSCPKAVEEDGSLACCNDARIAIGRCDCGADKANAIIDSLLRDLDTEEVC